MKPFFTYYGGKYRAAPRYPVAENSLVIEPFAGSAGYSLRHFEKEVILCDLDENICDVWSFLISSDASDILELPSEISGNIDLYDIHPSAKKLIGFWLNKGAASPCKTPSSWMRSGIRPNSFWGDTVKRRVADQVGRISHWKIIRGSYADLSKVDATWFVDPPYSTKAGRLYRHSDVDYNHLSDWVRSLRGQVIVCEHPDAEWLPFSPMQDQKSNPSKRGGSYSREGIFAFNTPTLKEGDQ